MPNTRNLKTIKARAFATAFSWSLLILLSVAWNTWQTRQQAIGMATTEAKAHLAKDLAFRKWASDRGLLYMPVSDKAQPSQSLSHVANRDIQSTDVAAPLNPGYSTSPQYNAILFTHAFIWLLGMATIMVIARRTKSQTKERLERELLLNEKNRLLETEIAERKKTELRLSAIFDFLPDASFVVDNEQRVIAWNRSIEQMTGVKKADIVGMGDHACTIPFYGDRRAHLIDLIDVTDDELEAKYKHVTRKDGILYAEAFTPALYNGHGAHVWAMVTPLFDQNGVRTGAIESIRDVSEQKNLENDLRDSSQRLLDIINFMPDATLIIDRTGCVMAWSREMTTLTGVAAEAMIGRCDYEHAIPFYDERRPILVDLALNPDLLIEKRYNKIVRSNDILYGESFVTNLRSRQAYLVASASTLRNAKGEIVGAIECIRDHTQQMKAQERISLLAMIFENSGEAIVITDKRNKIIETNKAFSRLTGYSSEEARGEDPRILKSGIEGKEFYEAMWSAITEKSYWQGEIWDKRKDSSIYPKWLTITAIRDDAGEIINYFAAFSDITERKEAEKRIEHMAHTDALTSLPNRHTLVERLTQALEQAKRSADSVAVLFIDLDRFKTINDSLGHHIGDILLFEVAARLKDSVRAADIVARFGGDEFVVVLPQINSAIDAAYTARQIQNSLSRPYLLENNKVHTTPSIGISIFPDDGLTVAELLKNADSAMYSAKALGRNNFQMFTAEMHTAAQQRLELEISLRSAIENEEFVLHYQPQIEAESGRLTGFEALVRWQSPKHGMVPPDNFIPVAEETGLIVEIGMQVLQMACRQVAQWQAAGLPPVKVAVNLSARQLRQTELLATICDVIRSNGISPEMIALEVTESMIMDNPEECIRILTSLNDLGIELAIDDFGTGYSSLSYLKLFPFDKLKIDRSFVKDIETSASDAAIASATIALAHTLGRKVIAEGVETRAQLDFLKQHGCDIIQGYYFSRPIPAGDVAAYIRGQSVVLKE
jgi:diguanylate cyclase (GGDEF)-like protein/PAS domain S-box-containing protein